MSVLTCEQAADIFQSNDQSDRKVLLISKRPLTSSSPTVNLLLLRLSLNHVVWSKILLSVFVELKELT